jgi:hypothetical protein
MSSSLAPLPPRGGFPATLEAVTSFRVKTAALSRPAAPVSQHNEMVVITDAEGRLVVYPPSEKLVILSAWRARPTR